MGSRHGAWEVLELVQGDTVWVPDMEPGRYWS